MVPQGRLIVASAHTYGNDSGACCKKCESQSALIFKYLIDVSGLIPMMLTAMS
jgi:hypothetical protein